MSGDWPQTQVVLTEAVKLSKGDRRRFLAEACVKRPELRDELLAILETYETASYLGELAPRDAEWIERNLATLQKMGLGVEEFGRHTFKPSARRHTRPNRSFVPTLHTARTAFSSSLGPAVWARCFSRKMSA